MSPLGRTRSLRIFSDDFSASSGWTGAGFGVSGGLGVITPTLGSELLTNGDLETWSSATNAGTWTETIAGTSTVNREGTTIHGGAFAARLDIDSLQSNAQIAQSPAAASGAWVAASLWAMSSPAAKAFSIDIGTTNVIANRALTGAYTQYPATTRTPAANPAFVVKRGAPSASASLYMDDISYKVISNLYAYRAQGSAVAFHQAKIVRTANTQAGLVHYSDASNLVIAYLDGAGNVKLDKLVAGTWTAVASAAVTYSAGAPLKMDRVTNGRYVISYNGATKIDSSAITDSAFDSALNWGIFSTYSANTFDDYYYAY